MTHLDSVRLISKTILLSSLISCVFFHKAFAQTNTAKENYDQQIELLLSRLILDAEGLRKAKISMENPEKSMEELLNYFRSRTSVKHPIDRFSKNEFVGNSAFDKDFKYADDALDHIFVGQPAYQSFFCGDDIDWNSRPVSDMEWVWQLNRMYFWNAMGRVYWHSTDEKYAEAWCAQIVDWVDKNPNDDAHKYAWRSIEAGIRGRSWIELYQRFIDAPSFTPEVLTAFLNSCFDHAQYLMTTYTSGSNWALMEAEGLAFIAITFPEFQLSESWKNEAFRRLNNEINHQVYPDGHQRELAIGYHMGCIGWFMRTYELAKMNNLESAFPDSYLVTIQKMCEIPMKIGLPNGTNVQFGDAWEGKPGQYNEKFLEWAKLFNRDDFLYLATDGREGAMPDQTAFALRESGLYSMRSGWDKDAICLVLKCGPDGGGHCQPDNGTFDLYAGGRNLMPDAGSYIYSGDPENRKWFRQTKIHQTLTLNGENTMYAPKLLSWKTSNDLDILVVENAGYEDLTHRRAVFFVDKKYFVIVDEAIGKGIGDVGLHFQLAPGKAEIHGKKMVFNSNFGDGWNVLVQTEKQKGVELIEEEGQVSFEYTKKMPRPAFGYHIEKKSEEQGVRFITLVAPYETTMPKINIKLIGKPEIGSEKTQLKIIENGNTRVIGYSL